MDIPPREFVVYRPLAPESVTKVRALQEEYASIDSFEPTENLRVTVLDSFTRRPINEYLLQELIKEAPDISKKTLDSEVSHPEFGERMRDMTRCAIKLILHDVDNEFHLEHKKFKNAVRRRIDPNMHVHPFARPEITIGYLDHALAVAPLLRPAEAVIGNMVHVGTTESNVGKVLVPEVKQPYDREPVHSIVVNEPIRTLKPGSIPQNLLASLRRPSTPPEEK